MHPVALLSKLHTRLCVVDQFGLDCNSQAFGIAKGFNLVAVGEPRDAHGSRINMLVDPERIKPSAQMWPFQGQNHVCTCSVGVAALTHG